ncbi:MAG: membrane-bound PQQ-dependent dehydrogenase, glucose/quinate/shikimate family [Alphaproteobacteria bacterium]|nr:membrane-bound PQQ-dependent dehydrogenase, glucose/quinate/shikimate family [Alphaproteobacteria bacterium]MBU0876359.1 membrane-bound PQQ-dependent dehydrogenase, glucose/quinate/shikimate family [Alphaproteobacteria bacterium]MBU1768371.1 membrane-bound PQQ-dependent dehydrogenase, glucose/quinate/shikimate family [Alphaproteobacteria bacterium]
MQDETPTRLRNRSVFAIVVGAILALAGVVLAVGGAWLALLGGSLYYLLVGVLLGLAGFLLIRQLALGVWVYVGAYVISLVWGLAEAGLDGWALLPFTVGPTVLLVLVLLTLPTLQPDRWRWRVPVGAGVVVVLALIIGGFVISRVNQPAVGAVPARLAATVADPSLLKPGTDWPAYGGSYAAQRYSPLGQITPENVDQLQRAWVFHTGDMPADPADSKYGAETTPLKVGNTLYLCSATNILIALDPATGQQRWRYDPQVGEEWIPYTAACRGVAYHALPDAAPDQACATRIIEGTLDGRLIAVDAQTGRPCADFGTNGVVDIKRGMGRVEPGMVSITSPPTIVQGVIVTGHQVLDGQKRSAPSGVIQGFDAVTGEKRWAWDMVNPQWTGDPPDGEEYARGTPNMWTIASGDEALGLVYLPMGNSAVDYWSGSRRPQEDEFSTSLVALDVNTGKPRWHFQTVHRDVWDYDLGAQATLVDFPSGNGTVPALILPSKQGDMYVLDRRTGQPIFPVQERRVPRTGVEPQRRSPTQPFSTYHTLAFPDLTEKDMWGMSPIDQMVCRIQFRQAEYRGVYTPPTAEKRFVEYPGYNGGTDWGGIAVDPVRGVILANYNNMPNYNRLIPREEAERLDVPAPRGEEVRGGSMGEGGHGSLDPQAGTPYAIAVNAGWRLPLTGLLCKRPPYGGIRAIDMRTGRTIWDRPFGTARRNGPWNIPSMLPVNIGTPNNGGAVVTSGGVAFIAAATDNLIRAIDIETGETLWHDTLPAGGQATPSVYEINGKQYVVIMAGGHHFMETPIGDELIAYALPD